MPQKTLNGKQCCALDLPCCIIPPGVASEDAQAATLGKVIQGLHPDLSEEYALTVSRGLLSHFDLVPKGVGKAIVNGYRPWLTKTAPTA